MANIVGATRLGVSTPRSNSVSHLNPIAPLVRPVTLASHSMAATYTRAQPVLAVFFNGSTGTGGGSTVPTTGQIWPRGSKAGIQV